MRTWRSAARASLVTAPVYAHAVLVLSAGL